MSDVLGAVLPSGGHRNDGSRYEILGPLAKGGMAELYLARLVGIEKFEKLVALKCVRPELSNDAEFVQMFMDEARLAALLHHSNIVQVFDLGRLGDIVYFAMEYLHGQDLASILNRLRPEDRQLPLEHAVAIVREVCAGLHFAHEMVGRDGKNLEIVHRDVSPQNIFVTYDGDTKIVDFGVAKAASHLAMETRTGILKGKLSYMPPEQIRARTVDRRGDVFSLSVVLWELTVGRKLYNQHGDFDILKAILEEDAPLPSTVRPGYPPRLEAIVRKGLARDPNERYQTAQELQVDLEVFAHTEGLVLSRIILARLIRELFEDKLAAWDRAQKAGTVEEHILASANAATEICDAMAPTIGDTLSGVRPAPLSVVQTTLRMLRLPDLGARPKTRRFAEPSAGPDVSIDAFRPRHRAIVAIALLCVALLGIAILLSVALWGSDTTSLKTTALDARPLLPPPPMLPPPPPALSSSVSAGETMADPPPAAAEPAARALRPSSKMRRPSLTAPQEPSQPTRPPRQPTKRPRFPDPNSPFPP